MGRNGKSLFKECKVSPKQGEYFLEISHIVVTVVYCLQTEKFVKKVDLRLSVLTTKRSGQRKLLEAMFIILIAIMVSQLYAECSNAILLHKICTIFWYINYTSVNLLKSATFNYNLQNFRHLKKRKT